MTNRLTSPHKRAERTCALVGSAGNPEIELDLIEWDYDDLTSERCASAIVSVRKPGAMRFSHRRSAEAPERCASAIVAVRKPRSDALQPSLQCGSPERCASAIVTARKPGAMRFSHRFTPVRYLKGKSTSPTPSTTRGRLSSSPADQDESKIQAFLADVF